MGSTPEPDWLRVVAEQLRQQLDRPLRVADLARQAGVHRVHLGRVFQARYGMPLREYHRRLRIEWAARELLERDASVGDLAQRAGFADQAHFTRYFKRQLGVTPTAYRARERRARSVPPGRR